MNRFLFALIFFLSACTSSSVKDKINQAGDAAGQVAGEFMEGASKGVEKAFDVKLELSAGLSERGIRLGKCTISNDSVGTDNLLTAYLIFDKEFTDTLHVKAFEDGLEIGRAHAAVGGRQNEAAFVDFHFDKRTNLDSKNTLKLE